MKTLFATIYLGLCVAAPVDAQERPGVLIVTGAPGTPEYEALFRDWADRWQAAADRAGAGSIRIGESEAGGESDLERLQSALADQAATGREVLWIVLIGHGTFDGREAKFNLRGPDVSAEQLAGWLESIDRPIALINCASASGPFINQLSGEDRVVVTATRSGDEQNFARFGQYLAGAIADPTADLDKDGQVSLLEAFLMASSRVNEFYRTGSRLATEHALLDDNGDGLGTPPDWFRGVRATKRARDGAELDGIRAHQYHLLPSDRERAIPPEVRERRDEIEQSIAALRDQKTEMTEDDYYEELEPLMLELARLYRAIQEGDEGAANASR